MIKACREFLEVNKGEQIMTIYSDRNMVLRDSQDISLVRGLGEYKKSELVVDSPEKLVFSFWHTSVNRYEVAKKYEVKFFHDFYNDGDNIIANNCYNETVWLSPFILDNKDYLLNYLLNHFTLEVQQIISEGDKNPDAEISFDGDCLEVSFAGKTFPLILINE